VYSLGERITWYGHRTRVAMRADLAWNIQKSFPLQRQLGKNYWAQNWLKDQGFIGNSEHCFHVINTRVGCIWVWDFHSPSIVSRVERVLCWTLVQETRRYRDFNLCKLSEKLDHSLCSQYRRVGICTEYHEKKKVDTITDWKLPKLKRIGHVSVNMNLPVP
jgi:hypothetical protein